MGAVPLSDPKEKLQRTFSIRKSSGEGTAKRQTQLSVKLRIISMWICPNCRKMGPRSRICCPFCDTPVKSLDNDMAFARIGFVVGACVTPLLLFFYTPSGEDPNGRGAYGPAFMYMCFFGSLAGGAVFTLGAAAFRGLLWLYSVCCGRGSGRPDAQGREGCADNAQQNITLPDSMVIQPDIDDNNANNEIRL
jgi:hypothetical protein